MKIKAPGGELVTDFLFKQIGQDDDALEAAFYRLNPHVRGELFNAETYVVLPEATRAPNVKKVTRSWD
ncbi:hypothetical protein P0Y67_01030 [Photobacterium sp. SP02]|uniref:hypothetical protein n=1 Tax=Photobacterium sp. SP02 TaxID=3032280 RepID=UPI00314500D5